MVATTYYKYATVMQAIILPTRVSFKSAVRTRPGARDVTKARSTYEPVLCVRLTGEGAA